MAAQLVDNWGYPVTSRGPQLLDVTRSNNDRPSWLTATDAIHKSVSYQDWRTMLSASRRLWANYDVLKGATSQKAMHSIGRAWEPEFRGVDKAWGDIATAWLLNEWYGVADVRGENYDFKTDLFLSSQFIDRDGNSAILLTETKDGYPQIQLIGIHRIGCRGSERIVEKGAYKGLRIELGVIMNAAGRPVAYRILGASQELDQDVSARDLMVKFDPEWSDQALGFPGFSGSINFIRDNLQSHAWEHQAQLIASRLGMVEWNETGTFDPDAPENLGRSSSEATATTLEKMEGGTILKFKAGSGSKVEFAPSNRPGDQWDSFQDRTIRMALLGINWPYSLCWKPEGANGTAERSEIEKARTSIRDRQDLLEPVAKRIVGYAVSKAIKLKILPEYPGKDVGGSLMWGFSKPAEFSIDKGRDGKIEIDNYKLGWGLTRDHLAKNGMKGTVKDHWVARAHEIADMKQAMAEVSAARGVEIDAREMQMLNPNEPSAAQVDASATVDTPPET